MRFKSKKKRIQYVTFSGNQYWLKNNSEHRTYGPAYIYFTGGMEWWVHGDIVKVKY